MGWLLSATVLASWLILATRWFGSDRRDDGSALRSHQHALDRLRHADGNLEATASDEAVSAQAHVRLLPPRRGGPPPAPRTPPAKPATPVQRVERPAVTEAPPPPDPVRPAPDGLADLLPLRTPRRRLSRLTLRWPRSTKAAVGGALAVLLLGVVVVGAGLARDDSSSSVTTEDVAETEPTPSTPSSESEPAPDPPPVPAVRLAAFDGQTASYVVSADSVSVALAATAPCWVEVSSAADQVVFQGTVPAGGQQTFQDPAGLVLRLGNPGAVGLQVNGAALELPPEAQDGAPIDLDLRTEAALAGAGAVGPGAPTTAP